jgi:hypothetical protein
MAASDAMSSGTQSFLSRHLQAPNRNTLLYILNASVAALFQWPPSPTP